MVKFSAIWVSKAAFNDASHSIGFGFSSSIRKLFGTFANSLFSCDEKLHVHHNDLCEFRKILVLCMFKENLAFL